MIWRGPVGALLHQLRREQMRRFLITAMIIAATISSVNAQTTSRPEPAKLDENCKPIPTGRSWSELGADAPRELEEGRRQIAVCREALMLRLAKEAARTTRPDEALPFVPRDVISFVEPTMSCTNPDDARVADRQTADWLAAHNCKNLDPSVKEWVVVTVGSKRLLRDNRTVETYGCVVDKRRSDQLWADSYDTYRIGMQLSKECRYVVRKVQY
jgi:hypothetical protein